MKKFNIEVINIKFKIVIIRDINIKIINYYKQDW